MSLDKVLRAIEALRSIDPDMPTQTASVFLTVAANEGMKVSDAERLGLTRESASRNVKLLSGYTQRGNGKPGLGLIEYRVLESDYRVKVLYLTEAGREMRARLAEIVG